MSAWQKVSGLAGALANAGGGLLGELAHVFGLDRGTEPRKDIAFTIGVIALSAKMAKADGVVSPLEVQAFKQVFEAAPEIGNVGTSPRILSRYEFAERRGVLKATELRRR
jgi:DnaJ like chaperone protein